MSKGLLVEIDISDLVWDEQTDGSHEYACDRIDEFIDEISDQNKRHLQIPFSQLNDKLSKLKINGKYILFCENGERSESAIQFLRSEHNFTNLLNFHTQTS